MDQERFEIQTTYLNNKIEVIKRMIAIVEELRDIPNAITLYTGFDKVDFDIPYNLALLNETSEWLKERGYIEYYRYFGESSGILIVRFHRGEESIPVRLSLDTKLPGSTCKLNKIGEITQPIYETVCLEA